MQAMRTAPQAFAVRFEDNQGRIVGAASRRRAVGQWTLR